MSLSRSAGRLDIPDLRQLDGEMRQQHQLRASPLLLRGWNFLILNLVLVEVGNSVDYDPGQAAAEVDLFIAYQFSSYTSNAVVVEKCGNIPTRAL